MSKRAHAGLAVVAAALMMGAFAIGAVAQQQPAPQRPGYDEGGPSNGPVAPYVEPMISLTGMLQSDGADGWTLVDQASGDSIELKKKSKKLAAQEGGSVTVTGRWKKNDETTKIFKVSKVEPAPAAAVEATDAAAPAQAPTDSPSLSTTPEDPAAPTDPSIPEQPATPADPAIPEQPAPEVPEAPAPSTP